MRDFWIALAATAAPGVLYLLAYVLVEFVVIPVWEWVECWGMDK